jgi:hypothetical protein
MQKNIFIFVILSFLMLLKISAQKIEAVKNPELPYQFWIHYPEGYEENPVKKYPFILFLHGRSLSGTDLEKVKKYGIIYEILRGMKLEFVVIAPQCQNGWENKKLIQILDFAEKNYRIDKSKIYLTGMSMGGYGSWYLAGEYPGRFAAVSPVCGGGKISDANNLKSLPHWVFHGAKDNAVPIAESEKMVAAIKAAGNKRVEFTVYQDQGHDLHGIFRNRALYDWFLKYTRSGFEGNLLVPPVVEKPKPVEPAAKTTKPVSPEKIVTEKPLEEIFAEDDKKTNTEKLEEDAPAYIAFEEPAKPDNKSVQSADLSKKKSKSKNKWWEFWKWKFWEQLK